MTAADGYGPLGVRARLAAALLTVESWLRAYRLDDAGIAAVLEHMWQYLTVTYDTFGAWYEFYELQGPEELLAAIDQEPLPRRVALICEDRGVPAVELVMLLADVVNMVYDDLFGAVNLQHRWNGCAGLRPSRHVPAYRCPVCSASQFPASRRRTGTGGGRVTVAQVAHWRGRP